ncbi:MAG: A/G-specific adenine glycosylase [Gemmatimonadota bacterium]|nr:MAG: A/G-specific adenine glycosylase [Gemmatimonadota bacterium]
MKQPSDTSLSGLSPNQSGEFRRSILQYYDRFRRDLPWRGETDPYRILVSEIMLQQTRVETVLRYYESWLKQFPNLGTLASADSTEVLKAWEGLGYYRRARNLHRAAKHIRDVLGGCFPTSYRDLRQLPGVGQYTAGAVASIGFGEIVPAVDGNVRRVLARLFDKREPGVRWLNRTAADLVDKDRPGDWNQALMDLGSTICTPRSPRCEDCPVQRWCPAHEQGTQALSPAGIRKAPARETSFLLIVLQTEEGEVMLVRRPRKGLLAGMWAFPEQELARPLDCAATYRDRAIEVARSLGAEVVGHASALAEVQHRFTHIQARYRPWVVPVATPLTGEGNVWMIPGEQIDLPIPVAQHKVLNALAACRATPVSSEARSTNPSGIR